MKKCLGFVFMIVMAFALFGCGKEEKIADAGKYTIEKETVIKEKMTFDEALAEVQKATPDSREYMTCTMTISGDDFQTTTISKYEFDLKKKTYTGIITMTMASLLEDEKTESVTYVVDNYVLMEIEEAKYKMKLPSLEECENLFSTDAYEEYLTEIKKFVEENPDKIKAGYDELGCLVIEYNDGEGKYRLVIDNGYPVYMYYEYHGVIGEVKYSYEKTKVEIPESVKLEDYQEFPGLTSSDGAL